MMREILFRGRRLDNGEWVEGAYFKHLKRQPGPIGDRIKEDDIAHLIIMDGFADWNMPRPMHAVEVDPSTIGQFTGLLDKNGKRIWEGDVIDIGNGYHGIVIWDGFAWGLQIQEVNHTLYSWSAAVRLTEAIGNIHEPRVENDGE